MKKCPKCGEEYKGGEEKCFWCHIPLVEFPQEEEKKVMKEEVKQEKADGKEKRCPKCGRFYDKSWGQCLYCEVPLKEAREVKVERKIEVDIIKCKQCGGEMYKDTYTPNTGVGCIIALIGLLLSPIIIGIPIIIYGILYGGKTKGLWVCRKCGYQIERKES